MYLHGVFTFSRAADSEAQTHPNPLSSAPRQEQPCDTETSISVQDFGITLLKGAC